MKSSYTKDDAALMVRLDPGHTAHYYGNHGCVWSRVYAAFKTAEKHLLIKSEKNPNRKKQCYLVSKVISDYIYFHHFHHWRKSR